MVEQTPNHGLNKYEIGETDWSHNPDMQTLEERVTVRDTAATLDEYEPHLGAKFEATDTETAFYGTGIEWKRFETSGREPSFDAIDTVSLSIDGWRIIDVSQHGFAGDGSGGDLAEFIADHAGNVAFYLPNGTYRFERPIHFTGGTGPYSEPVPDRIAIVGRPAATLHVEMPAALSPSDRRLFTFGTHTSPLPQVVLRDLHVDVGDADPDRDAGIMRANIGEMMSAQNVSLSKRCRTNPDGSSNGDRHTYMCDVVSPTGVATHRNIDLTAGDVHVDGADDVGHAIPFGSEPNHVGTNRWVGCSVAGYTDNGFYLRDGIGSNILQGCTARNCGGAHIRLGKYDTATGCRITIDGSETPASGCGLWIQDAEATVVDGLRIDAPELENDAVRVSGDIKSGTLRNAHVLQGGTQYGIRATGDAESFTFDSVTIEDRGDGSVRLASIYISQDNTTFRDVTVLNRDHGASNGRASVAVAAENVSFDNCRFVTDNPYALILGTPFRHGSRVGAGFDRCSFQNDGTPTALARYEGTPVCNQLLVKNGRLDDYDTLIDGGGVTDFETAAVIDNTGFANVRTE